MISRRSFIKGILAGATLTAVPFKWTYKKVSKIFTGARARIFINGKEVAFVSDVTINVVDKNIDMPIYTIGKLDPVEIHCKVSENSEAIKEILSREEES